MAVGFWDMMFDSDYRRRSDINQALDIDQQLMGDVGALQAQVRSMTENLRMLSVTLAALIELSPQVDPAALRARAEEMLAELMRPPPRVAVPESIAHPKPPPPNTAPITCIKCQRSVPANTTIMTGDGPMCDPQCP